MPFPDKDRILKIISQNYPGLVCYWTKDLRCSFANYAFMEWFGVQAENIIGMHLKDLLGPELFSQNEPYMICALQGEVQFFERTITKNDGSVITTWSQYTPDIEDGKVRGVLTQVTDITELRAAKSLLNSANQILQKEKAERDIAEAKSKLADIQREISDYRLQVAMKHSPVMIFEQDVDLRYTWIFNPRLGFEVSSVIGKSDAEILDRTILDPLVILKREVMATGVSKRQEVSVCAPGQPLEYFDLFAEPLFDNEGKVAGIRCVATEVSDRKRTQLELERHQSLLQSIIDNSSTVIFVKNLEGRYLMINKHFSDILNIPKDVLLGRTDYDLFEKSTADMFREADQKVLAENKSSYFDESVLEKGETLHYQVIKFPLRNEDGQPYAVCGIGSDITERRRFDLQWQSVFSLSSIPIAILRLADEVFVEVNDAFLNVLGYSREEVIGHTSTELHLWNKSSDHDELMSHIKIKGYVNNFIGKYRSKLGRIGRFLASIHTIEYYGEPHLVGFMHDLSDLDETQKLLQLATQAAHIGTYTYDEQLGLSFWSKEMRQIVGVPEDQPESPFNVVPDFIHPDDVGLVQNTMIRIFNPCGDGRINVEHRVVRSDGSIRWVHSIGQAYFDGQGSQRRFVSIRGCIQDITEAKRVQQELIDLNQALSRRTTQAEIALAAKAQFLSSVSHELLTPLHTIKGYIDILLKNTEGETKRQIAIMERSSSNLLTLINGLLEFNLHGDQASELQPEVIDIRDFVEQVNNFGQIMAGKSNNQLSIHFACNIPILIKVDEQRLLQILQNLISNACKYTIGGQIVVEITRDIKPIHPAKEGYICLKFSVIDTGLGIPDIEQESIFEPFYRGKFASNNRPGVGLGLAIARKWTKLMGGDLKVESSIGKGSRFFFSLDLPVGSSEGLSYRRNFHQDQNNLRLNQNQIRAKTDRIPVFNCKISVDDLEVFSELLSLGLIKNIEQWARDLVVKDISFEEYSNYVIRCCQTVNLDRLEELLKVS